MEIARPRSDGPEQLGIPERPPALARWAAVGGAGIAALVSAGLVYWISDSDDLTLGAAAPAAQQTLVHAPAEPAAPAAPRFAPSRAEPAQVARAFRRVRDIYAEEGAAGVAIFARECPGAVTRDPAELDFCLAFDRFAVAFEGEGPEALAWREAAGARELALAATAVPPGVDAAARVAEIRRLVRQASLAAAAPPRPTPAQPIRVQEPAAVRPSQAASDPAACRLHAVAAPRTVCESPALRQADVRLRAARRKALAAGVSARRLAREEDRFRASVNAAAPDRAAVARLYKSRTRALEALARRG